MAGASAPDHVRKAYLKATGGTVDEEEDKSEAGASGFTLNRKIDSLGEDCPVYVSIVPEVPLTPAVTKRCRRKTTRRASLSTMRCQADAASVSVRISRVID